MIRHLRKLARDRRGASAVEFALISPILLTLIFATLNLGVYFFADNSVNNALDEAARDAAIYPTPSDSELQTIFDNALLKTEASGTVSLNVSHGTTGAGTKYVNLNASYSIPISLVLVDMGSIPASASRRVYVQD